MIPHQAAIPVKRGIQGAVSFVRFSLRRINYTLSWRSSAPPLKVRELRLGFNTSPVPRDCPKSTFLLLNNKFKGGFLFYAETPAVSCLRISLNNKYLLHRFKGVIGSLFSSNTQKTPKPVTAPKEESVR